MDFTRIMSAFRDEWNTVSQAPFSFVLIAVIAFTAAYLAARWRYSGVVDQVREQMNTLEQRLLQKTEQAENYKERALKFDEKVSDVVRSDAPELCARTLAFVSRIRDFIKRRKEQSDREMRSGMSRRDQGQWDESVDRIMLTSSETADEWIRSFKVDAMLLRDELYSRLNKTIEENRLIFMYEHPTNFFGYEDIATDLETQAKFLQSSNR
ncbi:hypothetical protein [Pseudomonas syringae]|uniref:hypothetical protein n=1 Tax=Pseudomonas syringae TaxID=317 RepID=UPI0015D18687|nr:hypothetical protein [Pseudomonas syringae]